MLGAQRDGGSLRDTLPSGPDRGAVIIADRARRHAQKIFFGWFIVGAGLCIQALQAVLLQRSFGAYVVFLEEDFGWNKTTFSGAFALQQVESGLLGPAQGWLIDRFGPRATMRIGTVMFGAGFMIFSQVESVFTFYLAFVLMALGSSLAGFFPISVTVVNWFVRRRSTALSVMQTGHAIGGLLSPLIALSLSVYGWRGTAFASGVFVIVVGLPLVQTMRGRPEQYGLLPDGDRPAEAGAAGGAPAAAGRGAGAILAAAPPATVIARPVSDFTAREALRTRAFWFISIGHGSALLVVQAVNVHAILFLNESLGYSVAEGSAVIALLTAMTIVGQLGGGILGDRFNKRYLLTGCMVGHATGMLALALANALWMVIFFAVAHGLAWGVRGPLQQTLRADYYGRTSFGVIMGFSNLIVVVGSVAGPLIAGGMADYFGTYRIGFTVLAVLAGLASFCWLLATRPVPPHRAAGLGR